jgi:Zn-dependent M28 family amino/carboxypeptidase
MMLMRRASLVCIVIVVIIGGWLGAAAQTPAIDRAVLLRDLQVLAADDMQGRQVDTPGGARARAYIIERFKASGVEPIGASYEMPFEFTTGALRRRGVNVIGRVAGSRQANRYIVVSAHYDHLGVRGGQVYNGADDNASGTAALISLARYFSTHKPQHTLILAAFDAEEAGLRGSRAFIANPPVPLSAIAVNVNVDMVGRDVNNKLYLAGTFLNPFLKPYLQRVAPAPPVTLLFGHDDPNNRALDDWTRDSDHWAFQMAGIPAIYLGEENYEQHHKATDDYETIMPDFFVGAAETAVRVVEALDRNLEAIASSGSREPRRPE